MNVVSRALVVASAVASVVLSDSVYAQRTDEDALAFALWLGRTQSDNLTLSEDGESGSYDSFGLVLDAVRNGVRSRVGVAADLEYRRYSLEELADERVGNFNAFADMDLVRDRFVWFIAESYGQVQSDLFRPVGPGNRETVNTVSTGPRINIPLARRMHLDMNGMYAKRESSGDDVLDSETRGGDLTLQRLIGPTARIGLTVNRLRTEYDGNAPSYAIEGAALRYDRELATGDVFAEIGRNRLIYQDVETTGPRVHLGWGRAIRSRSRLDVSVRREYTDIAALFGEVTVLDEANLLLTASPMEMERLELLYTSSSDRNDFSLGMSIGDEDYQLAGVPDNRLSSAYVELARAFSSRLKGTFTIDRTIRDFRASVAENRDSRLAITLERRLQQRFALMLGIADFRRRGENVIDERRYEVRLRYEPTR